MLLRDVLSWKEVLVRLEALFETDLMWRETQSFTSCAMKKSTPCHEIYCMPEIRAWLNECGPGAFE